MNTEDTTRNRKHKCLPTHNVLTYCACHIHNFEKGETKKNCPKCIEADKDLTPTYKEKA